MRPALLLDPKGLDRPVDSRLVAPHPRSATTLYLARARLAYRRTFPLANLATRVPAPLAPTSTLPLARRPLHTSLPTLKRRFEQLPHLAMDVQQLTDRIQALGLQPSSSNEATPVLSYFFTPKSGAKHPDNPDQDLKLVVASIEEAKNLGAAKALAQSVGLKDMRAVSGADLDKLLGRTRDQGQSRLPSPS